MVEDGTIQDIITSYIGNLTPLKVKLVVDMAQMPDSSDSDGIAEYQNLELRIKALEESLSKDFTVFNTITRNSNESYVYSNIVPNTDYTNFKTELSSEYLAIKGLKKSSQEIAVLFNIKYNSNGLVEKTKDAGYEVLKIVYLEIETYTSSDHPYPITTYEQFINMNEGENYILLNDITLPKNYTPIIADFKSLDGNGYKINLQGFNFTESNNNIGVFSEILSGTLVKNLKVNILPNGYYLNNVYRYGFEVNAQTLSSLNFGVFAGVNNGIITNCSVVNENIINKLSTQQVI